MECVFSRQMHSSSKETNKLTFNDLLIFKPTSGGGDWYTRFDFLLTSRFISRLSTSSSSFTLSGELKMHQQLSELKK